MSAENPRNWTQPVNAYRALDIVLTREQIGTAVAEFAINELGHRQVESVPNDAHCNLTISGDNVRCQFVWKDAK